MAVNKAVTDTQWSNAFSPGRPAGDPNVIVIHYWGVTGQKHQNVVNYLCRPGGDTSAHYVVSAGRVTQLVHDYDRAWHAGSGGNPRGIGIECRPEMSAGDFETVAKLIAAIRDEWGPLPLSKHNDYMSTSCPGPWASQLARLSARADEIRSGKKPATTTPAPAPATGGVVTVDGIWGPATTRALQKINGTPVDGVVSSQDAYWKSKNPGLGSGWEWVSNATGSQLIMKLQKAFGVPQDGLIGPATIKGLQRYYGTPQDGVISDQSQAVMAMQRAINKQLGRK